jgi:hypothetical protein
MQAHDAIELNLRQNCVHGAIWQQIPRGVAYFQQEIKGIGPSQMHIHGIRRKF